MFCPKFNIIGFNSYQAKKLFQRLTDHCLGVFDDGYAGLQLDERLSVKPIQNLETTKNIDSAVCVSCVFNDSSLQSIKKKLPNVDMIDVEAFVLAHDLDREIINFPCKDDLLVLERFPVKKLEDSLSRETFFAIIDYWKFGNRSSLKKICRSDQSIYFDEPFLKKNLNARVYVDVGAFDGDSFNLFQKKFPDFNEAHLFEPIQSINVTSPLVQTYKYALGNERRYVRFNNSGLNSTLNKKGEIEVELRKLDEFDITPTFIKIDAEGMDIEVLLGAKQTLLNYHPAIAISVYHKPLDLLLAYNELKNLGYKRFYLRKYQLSNEETVLYAL